jgi:hypothetical protein
MLHKAGDTFYHDWPHHSYLWIISRPAAIMKGTALQRRARVSRLRSVVFVEEEERYWRNVAVGGPNPCNLVGGSPTMPDEVASIPGPLFTVRTLPVRHGLMAAG